MAGGTVLLVEDDEIVSHLIHELLSDNGFETVTAATGESAFALLEQECPNLLLTDINMPGRLDGIALAKLARASHPDLPVIFITGRPDSAVRAQRFLARSLILPKPFPLIELLAAVRRLI